MGEFCGVMAGGSGCMHSWDGMTEALCNTPADCPRSLRERCEYMGGPVGCTLTTLWGFEHAGLGARKSCGCANEDKEK